MQMKIADARCLIEDVMKGVGHTAREASNIADHLIDCELRGLAYGGLPRALSIVERLRLVDERRPISVVRETPATACIDGGDQVGYLVALRATELAIQKARVTGIAAVGASKTWYTGAFSYYLEMVIASGLVGMIVGSGSPKVAPHGGTEARFNTNPIAFGFPSAGAPVIWDIGTSSVTAAEVIRRNRIGELLERGLAFDADGMATVDPAAALQGALTVWGGHRGSGLALSVQLLSMMAGQVVVPQNLRDCGFFISLYDPDVFTPPGEFKQKVSDFAALLRQTRPVNDADPVRVPFERSVREREKRRAAGVIDVDKRILELLQEIAHANH